MEIIICCVIVYIIYKALFSADGIEYKETRRKDGMSKGYPASYNKSKSDLVNWANKRKDHVKKNLKKCGKCGKDATGTIELAYGKDDIYEQTKGFFGGNKDKISDSVWCGALTVRLKCSDKKCNYSFFNTDSP